ncbi:CS1-pili formation C-terminal domain-containing protein [Candidatus Regiella insecticola]|uniref:CS1-pili formation C-terminal domain-containing protein n=1 Tax=Candidatus Regiella insecticola TaxID=138073 RepID=UPI0015968844|nr:CS1-pili formation C-terminal domain-containing protein [Candidatus Regiella insecticola]
MTLRGEYKTAGARRGASADIGLNTTATLAGRDVSVRLIGYDGPSYRTEQQRDRGAEIGLSFSLERKRKTHSVSAQFGLQDHKPYTNLNYNWRPEERGTIEYAGATVTANPDGLAFSGNAGLDNRWLNGDVYLQRGSKSENFYGGANLRNSLVLGGGSIATGQQLRSSQAVVIVDVESDQPDIKLEVSGGESSAPRLQPGKNIVGVSTWQQQRLQFHGQGEDGVKIYPEDYSLRMNRGSVNYLKLRAVKTQTVVGMLKDKQGNLLRNQEVASDVGKARINSEGVFTLEVSAAKPQITVTGDDGKPRLVYSLPPSPEGERDEVRFVDVLTPSASPLS